MMVEMLLSCLLGTKIAVKRSETTEGNIGELCQGVQSLPVGTVLQVTSFYKLLIYEWVINVGKNIGYALCFVKPFFMNYWRKFHGSSHFQVTNSSPINRLKAPQGVFFLTV